MFLRPILIFGLLFFQSSQVISSGINDSFPEKLTVQFKQKAPAKIFLYSFYGVKSVKIDSAIQILPGKFNFDLTENIPSGFYRVSINDTNYVDLILSFNESVELVVNGNNLKRNTRIIKSKENLALWELKEYRLLYNNKKKELLQGIQKADGAKMQKLKRSLDSLEKFSNAFTLDLLGKNKGTYFALTNRTIISPFVTDSILLVNKYKNDSTTFMKENFFNNIDFTRSEVLNSTLLPNQYMKYFEKYVDYDEEGFKYAIEHILSKAKVNTVVYEYSLDFLLNLFNEAGPEIIFEYIASKYYNDSTCGEAYAEKIKKIRSLSIGNLIPEIEFQDFKDYKNLKDVYKKNKLTLVYFWSSHCSFCSQSMPLIKETYFNYRSAGFEIVGISLDENKKEWEDYVKSNNIEWINYNEFKGWDSGVVRKMMVNKTPTYYLVNSFGIIVAKNHNFVDIREYIFMSLEKRE